MTSSTIAPPSETLQIDSPQTNPQTALSQKEIDRISKDLSEFTQFTDAWQRAEKLGGPIVNLSLSQLIQDLKKEKDKFDLTRNTIKK